MTSWDRWRIKAEAWGEAAWKHLPTVMILAGGALLLAAVVGFWDLW